MFTDVRFGSTSNSLHLNQKCPLSGVMPILFDRVQNVRNKPNEDITLLAARHCGGHPI